MKKILFLIHDLGHGGAEKVLVNLVNNMDPAQFDITVMALFGGGVNEQFLGPNIHYRTVYRKNIPANSHWMKLFTPRQLHHLYIKEHYDIEISYLEGPSARIISGCQDPDTKLVSWVHCTMHSSKDISRSFRSGREAKNCYNNFHCMAFVSQGVKAAFLKNCPYGGTAKILYNTNESQKIQEMALSDADSVSLPHSRFLWCGMGKLTDNKGFDRMLRIEERLLREGYPVHFCALGSGPLQDSLMEWTREHGIEQHVTFLGYQTNPYKYLAKCDLFVCASHAEGFSTAATEALIVGTPVCTVEVSGMREMLGEHNEYGLVTENSEEALYEGIKKLLDDPELLAHYRQEARCRAKIFSTENTVKAVQDMLLDL